jgi:hypothetical protein
VTPLPPFRPTLDFSIDGRYLAKLRRAIFRRNQLIQARQHNPLNLIVMFCPPEFDQMPDKSSLPRTPHFRNDPLANLGIRMITQPHQLLYALGSPDPTKTDCRREMNSLIGAR